MKVKYNFKTMCFNHCRGYTYPKFYYSRSLTSFAANIILIIILVNHSQSCHLGLDLLSSNTRGEARIL